MNDKAKEHPLAKLRKEKGLSRAQLSELLNGSPSVETIGRIERGERSPREDTIELISNVLGCEPDYLRGRIKYPSRITSEIADQIPLNEDAINLLIKLNEDIDESSDTLFKANLISYLIRFILDYDMTGGAGEQLILEAIDLAQLQANRKQLIGFRKNKLGESLQKRSPDRLRQDPEFRDCERNIAASKSQIGNLLSMAIGEYCRNVDVNEIERR